MTCFPTTRRTLMLLMAAPLAAFGPAAHAADPFPAAKPVTIVTAFAPGSGPDAVLRIVAEKLGKTWNQRVLVENKPGGGGFIAIDAAKRAAPDGYTLLQLDSEHLAALPHLYKARNFVTLQTLDPVAPLFRTPFMVAVAADSKWKSMTDLVTAAKAAPQAVTYGSWGVGSPGHLGAELLSMQTGTAMQHVPFREVIADLSRFYHLQTGDLIFTGTPEGVGPVVAGDRIDGHIDGVGEIRLHIGAAE